ncbi:MAG TPA: tetratricopeptide repeat protein [bacterium]|nr:tetratricopeptide repeat protein [bacterium]
MALTMTPQSRTAAWLMAACLCALIPLGPARGQDNIPQIVKKISPSVVLITTFDAEGNELALGSGFFVSAKGEVVTNRHVVEGASAAKIKTAQGKEYDVTGILADDIESDLALLATQTPGPEARPLALAGKTPDPGERVLVIGNPLGLEGTVTEGIVSAVRDLPSQGKVLQISAAISPGSSGSPVVNMKGQVIGVASFQLLEGQNLNFAMASELVDNLKKGTHGKTAKWSGNITGPETREADSLFAKGLAYVWQGEYEKAIPFFEKAVKMNPRDGEAFFYLGLCYIELGQLEKAIHANKQAIQINPDSALAHNNLGNAYSKLGLIQEAIGEYKQAVRMDPDFALAHYNLGVTYDKLGRTQEAIGEYKQAIKINPDDADAHLNLGVGYNELGRTQEATEEFKQALRINPDDAVAHNNLGLTYGKLGRMQEATEEFKQALKINPDYAVAHYGLGVAYLMAGDKGAALEEYKVLKGLDNELADKLFNLIYE